MYDTCLLSKDTGRKHENKEDAARYPTPASSKRCFHSPIPPLFRGALDNGSFGYLMLLASAMRPRNARTADLLPKSLARKAHCHRL